MKKAFTLVELLGVLVILGIILAIATPIVNSIINESKQVAYEEQINILIKQATLFSTKNNLGYENNNYKTIEFEELIDDGFINEIPKNPLTNETLEGCIVYAWKNEISQYDFKYEEECNPDDDNDSYKVTIEISNTFNWYNEDIKVNVITNGNSYQYCVSNTECIPNKTGEILIVEEGVHTVCAVAQNYGKQSEVVCQEFKLDKTTPVLEAKELNITLLKNTNNEIKEFFTYSFGISGGELLCDFNNTIELKDGLNQVTCTANGNNNLKVTKSINITITEPNLMISGEEFQNKIGTYRDTIKEINFLSSKSGKYETATIKWDLSEDNNEVVVGYIEEVEGRQILNIESNGKIIAHEKLGGYCTTYNNQYKSLFCKFIALENINFNNALDTSNVTDMSYLFQNNSKLLSLDLSSIDTSNVINMTNMFNNVQSITTLDLSNFNTSKVTSMLNMFASTISLTDINLTSFNTKNVTNMNYMFTNVSKIKTIDVSSFDTSNVTTMTQMFGYMYSLENLDLSNFNTSKVTSMAVMFSGSAAKNIILTSFDTSNVTTMTRMFNYATRLETLDLSSFDTSKVNDFSKMFTQTTKVTTAYAKTTQDALNFNNSSEKAANINFIVKP